MKKSKVIIGTAATLTAIWLAGSWYTGRSAEQEYFRKIEEINQTFAKSALSKNIKITYQNTLFDRGILSSHIEDQINLQINDKNSVLPLSSTLYHGPLPLNQLRQFNLIPSLFSLHTTLGKSEATAPLFELTKGKSPLDLILTISYALNVQSELQLNAGKINQEDLNLIWSDAKLNLDVKKNQDLNYKLSLDNLDLKKTNETMLKIKGFSAKGEMLPTQWPLIFTGKGQYDLAYMEQNNLDEFGQSMNIIQKNIHTDYDTKMVDNALNLSSKSNIGEVQINENNLGKLTYNMELNHIDGNALQEILDTIIELSKTMDEYKKTLLIEQLKSSGLAILENQPKIKLNPLAISDGKGEMKLDLNIGLVKEPKFNLMKSGLYKQFTDFSIDININKETAIALLEKLADNDEKTLANETFNEIILNGEQNGYIVNNEKNITLTLSLENNQLKLNNRIIPEEQVKMVLFMLVMNGLN
ncbi:YdgA family protein [Peptoniphilus asaccharolyticus]